MLFHGLGGNRQSIAPIAQHFAENGYAVLTFDLRGHGAVGRPRLRLDGPRDRRRRDPPRALAPRAPEVSDARRRLGHLARRRRAAALARRGRAVRGGRGRRDVDRPLRRARPAGPAEVGGDLPVPRGCRARVRRPSCSRSATRSHAPNLPALKAFAGARSSRQLLGRGYAAHVLLPGPPRLRLRPRPGDCRLRAPERPEAALRRRPSATRPRRSPARTSSCRRSGRSPGSTATSGASRTASRQRRRSSSPRRAAERRSAPHRSRGR